MPFVFTGVIGLEGFGGRAGREILLVNILKLHNSRKVTLAIQPRNFTLTLSKAYYTMLKTSD